MTRAACRPPPRREQGLSEFCFLECPSCPSAFSLPNRRSSAPQPAARRAPPKGRATVRTRIVDRARACITDRLRTPADKVAAGSTHIAAIEASPSYATATAIQTATAAWKTENTTLTTVTQDIADLESKLDVLRASQLSSVRRWDLCKLSALSAVNSFCDGSKDRVLSFGMSVQQRTPAPKPVVPEGLKGRRSKKVGVATVVWKAQAGSAGFLVQYASNPADAATYAAPAVSPKVTFELTGQTPGAMISFRVAAVDPSSPQRQTEYTPWLAVRVSS
jgi:hypothetical protein